MKIIIIIIVWSILLYGHYNSYAIGNVMIRRRYIVCKHLSLYLMVGGGIENKIKIDFV